MALGRAASDFKSSVFDSSRYQSYRQFLEDISNSDTNLRELAVNELL